LHFIHTYPGFPSTSPVGIFEIIVAKNLLDGTIVTLFIAILDQVLTLIIKVSKVLLIIVISDVAFVYLDGLPEYS